VSGMAVSGVAFGMASDSARVAIVGGHPVILGVVRLACEAQPDLTVAGEASTGADAVAMAIGDEVDVLLLDLDLPDVDGLEILDQVRAMGYSGAILALSDRTDGATVLAALRRGADGYLAKGEGLRHVGEALKSMASGGRIVDPALEKAAVLELGKFARQAREGADVGATLTAREREILELVAAGLTVQQVGRRLGISPRTVETHVSNVYRKLEVRSRVQAVARAASLGLIDFR
jgi:DNA-binding NarL/FixJ family response regulator